MLMLVSDLPKKDERLNLPAGAEHSRRV